MFAKHYQSELLYLRERGREFGLAHPDVAGLLAERGGDPDVERLLEGFAFLSAQIRERVEDAVPEIAAALTELLLPHLARTRPAATLLEFTPLSGVLRGRQRIPRGTEVAAVPVDGTSCRFRTTQDVDLVPAVVADVSLDRATSARPELRVSLQIQGPGHAAVFHANGLRLHFHGDLPLASTLFLWFARHLEKVVLEDGAGKRIPLGPPAIGFPGFAEEASLWPWPRFAPPGYRLLEEYFLLPAKLLFVDVLGLERGGTLTGDRFDLVFSFARPPELPARPTRDTLRLHCSPAVNLFSSTAAPVTLDTPGREHLLRAADVKPAHMEIYSVDAVSGSQAGRRERTPYAPFFAFEHAAGERPAPYFALRRRRSEQDDAIDTHLSVLTPRDVAPALDGAGEVLSIDLTCTNRELPARLRAGDVSVATPRSPTTATFRNIAGVTRPVLPALGSEQHWRLLSHLALSARSLAQTDALRALLALYNVVAEADEPAGHANRMRIEAIRRVVAAPARCLLDGGLVRGLRLDVELDERGFASRGDAFLFGAVLDELFAQHVTLNSFSELGVTLQPSQARMSWKPRTGHRPLL
jgi:type VI secretion system protein ImpG